MPQPGDWVVTRHKCSVASLMTALKAEARASVERRNRQLATSGEDSFGFEDDDQQGFRVWDKRGGGNVRNAVDATLTADRNGIDVKQAGRTHGRITDFVVTPVVSLEGECVCDVAGEQMQHWQAARKALELLLFS